MSARVRQVATWDMTSEELARVWAEQHGVTAAAGGWLSAARGPLCQGWDTLTASLAALGITTEGQGVDWRRSDLLGVRHVLAVVRRDAEYGRRAARIAAGGRVR